MILAKPQYSINEFPAEILGHIFQIGVETEEDNTDEDKDDSEDDVSDAMSTSSPGPSGSNINAGSGRCHLFQVLASHVCRYWREVALNLPVLWKRLEFNGTLQLDKAKAFINRAHGLPLIIQIDCTPTKDTDEGHPDHPYCDPKRFLTQSDLMQILDLIEPEVSHWEAFHFAVIPHGYVQSLLSRLHKLPSAPLLVSFRLCHAVLGNYEFFDGNYLPFHGNTPLLKSVVFWGIHIDWDNSLSFLRGLREFSLGQHPKEVQPSYITFAQIIKNSPDLLSLVLMGSMPALATVDDEGQWDPEPLDIPSVHHLVLRHQGPQYASALIQHFHFPNLRDLELYFNIDEDYSSFVRQLSVPDKGRSNSILYGLEKLMITQLTCDVTSTEMMLGQLTELKYLHLSCPGPEDVITFAKLIKPSAGRIKQRKAQIKTVAQTLPKIFCPALETLVLNGVPGSNLKLLVTERKKAGARLKLLAINVNDGVTVNMVKWLKKNVETVMVY